MVPGPAEELLRPLQAGVSVATQADGMMRAAESGESSPYICPPTLWMPDSTVRVKLPRILETLPCAYFKGRGVWNVLQEVLRARPQRKKAKKLLKRSKRSLQL